MRQIIYFSTAFDRQDAAVIAAIVTQSREHNSRNSITGLLVAGGHRYLQVVEGPDAAVEQLVRRLRRDDRHVGMTVMVDRRIDGRSFDGWSIAYAREPRMGEFATFADLVAQMRSQLKDRGLRDQLDCFERGFSSATSRTDAPLWQTSPRDGDGSVVDRGH